MADYSEVSETKVFEMKLHIQDLEEKLTRLAGGTNGRELAEVVIEKEAELEKKNEKLKLQERQIYQLAEGAKRVEAKRRELIRQYEEKSIRMRALESEFDRQLEAASVLRQEVASGQQALAQRDRDIEEAQAKLQSSEEAAGARLREAHQVSADLQGTVDDHRAVISDLESSRKELEDKLREKDQKLEELEARRAEIAKRGRTIKRELEDLVKHEQSRLDDMTAQLGSLKYENQALRNRLDEKTQAGAKQEKRVSDLAKENGKLATQLEVANAEIQSLGGQLSEASKQKQVDQANLLEREKDVIKLQAHLKRLKKDMEQRLGTVLQEKAAVEAEAQEQRKAHEERESMLHGQVKCQEENGEALVDAMEGEKRELKKENQELERQLGESRDAAHILEEKVRAVKKEADAVREQAAEAARAVEAMRKEERGRVAAIGARMDELQAEVDKGHRNAARAARLETENTELRAKVESQQTYMRRKLDQEKKTKFKGRPGVPAVLPLPPFPSPLTSSNPPSLEPSPTQGSATATTAAPASSSSSASKRLLARAASLPSPRRQGKENGGGGGGGSGGAGSGDGVGSGVRERKDHYFFAEAGGSKANVPVAARRVVTPGKQDSVRAAPRPSWVGSGSGGSSGFGGGGGGARTPRGRSKEPASGGRENVRGRVASRRALDHAGSAGVSTPRSSSVPPARSGASPAVAGHHR